MGSERPTRRHRTDSSIWLICFLKATLVLTGLCWRIHVLQIRQSLIASDQKYQRLLEEYQEMNRTQRQRRLQNDELNSTLEYRTSENSRLDLSLRTCLKNVSALDNNVSVLESKLLVLESNHSTLENKVLVLESNLSVLSSNLSDQRQMQTDLLDNFRHLEMKYGTLNETKAEICQLLSSRKEPECSQDWIRYEGRCYFISTFERSYDVAKRHCSNSCSKLFEIYSTAEELGGIFLQQGDQIRAPNSKCGLIDVSYNWDVTSRLPYSMS
ncbi:B-cell differentiation antigen CD72-like [Mobula hypostoma]|uniref:B-cell differentiation antigen CD72-like n=1 Tax=Mobula hypostoma TaxID=723540 RepID=UPI002FC3B314